MKKIMYTNTDNGISIVIPAPKASLEEELGPLTDTEYSTFVIGRSVPEGVTLKHIEDTDIPTNREFRDAWCDVLPGSQIDIDCDKAKEIGLKKLRQARDKLLSEQDKIYFIADEIGSDKSIIIAEKQRLRDLTNPLKALTTTNVFNDETILDQIRTLMVAT